MFAEGRLSIWNGDPAMDSWYNATVPQEARSHNPYDALGMDESLFFDMSKANQVNSPSGTANDWFYSTNPTAGVSDEGKC